MEDSSEKQEEKVEMEDNCTLESRNENGLSVEKSVIDTESSNRINEQSEIDQNEKNTTECPQIIEENLNSSKSKETGTKTKRKIRSTRRRLNAMINNSSLHFSDTDSEGELTTINSQIKPLNNTEKPIISVTSEVIENESSNYLSLDDKDFVKRNNFIENMTDVDEIYPSELENEEKENQDHLKIVNTPFQTETDFEDLEGEDEVQSPIHLKPRSDIFCDYSGETITTKEGDGPFSVEVRNKIYGEDSPRNETCGATPDIVVMSNTDEEDMAVSGDEDEQEACCSQKELFEDLDVLVASQVIMKNKMENLLTVKEISDDGTSDCHTDVEDVDTIE
ncbi:uncharacterized protein LOC107996088 [Apis cerana]|uniref:uncharacterized protein LOC107996088 n=1 Tax=Apis cerana TaxID=7461 RepID=UPI0007E2C6A9|nr:uncharacterized protein LOC107996088 [Apis cerana]XP_061930034.1 uncharacterized protein LOC107996088 [Apis cerana]XP_061930035.1 uncharacterized protein LOC107996088 [Apis cerana]